MSIKVMSMVWENYPEGGSELLALLALADWSNDAGACFPSMASIAMKTRLSRSQAQRVVHGLIEAKFVFVLENAMGGAPGMTRRYRINLEKLTGSAGATGRIDAADGSHGCGETGRKGATLTVTEPPLTTKRERAIAAQPPPSLADKQSKARTLKTYLAECKAGGVRPIPDNHSLRAWAAEACIIDDMLQIAWELFKERYTEAEKGKSKQYKDWPATFARAVKENWFKLWFVGDSGMQWSSVGMTHKKVLDAQMARQEVEHA
jgi:hypothetical protein